MYYSVASVDYGSCIRNLHRRIRFFYSVDGFSHNFSLPLYDTFAHYVFLKQIISVWKIHKTTLHVVYSVQYILQIGQHFFNSHI